MRLLNVLGSRMVSAKLAVRQDEARHSCAINACRSGDAAEGLCSAIPAAPAITIFACLGVFHQIASVRVVAYCHSALDAILPWQNTTKSDCMINRIFTEQPASRAAVQISPPAFIPFPWSRVGNFHARIAGADWPCV